VRILIPIIAVLALVGGLAAIKANQIGLLMKTGQAAEAAGPPPETVSSARVEKDTWRDALQSIGSVVAGRGVTVSNDSPGIVTRIHFDSGDEVKIGKPLVELETRVEQAQLASALARLELAETTLARTRALEAQRVATTAELDSAASTLKTVRAEAAALRAQIARKVVNAPFGGKLGIRLVNVGQYLSPGSPITTLQSSEEEYVDFSFPQEHLDELRVGLPVRLVNGQSELELDGVVAAVDPAVDQVTRSVTLRASTKDAGKRLRPGMFLNVNVMLDRKRDVVVVPATAAIYAPYGDSVFLIEKDPKNGQRQVARQQFVQLGESRGDFVEVTKGLKGGETIVSVGAFKLRNGLPVKVNNDIELDPKLQPTPENR
jgi:membrane fusion protein (multidrug efflux system)